MKNTIRFILLPLASLLVGSIAQGAVPSMDVEVTNSGGKVAYKGTTNADGGFSTGNLAPGNYVVQFTSKSAAVKSGQFGLAVSAGKNTMSANSVAGEKIATNGVAMKLTVATATKITGQVGKPGTVGTKTVAAQAQAKAKSGSGGSVKIINGKRYVWVVPQASTLEGGHWVEEGSTEDAKPGAIREKTPPQNQSKSGMGSARGY